MVGYQFACGLTTGGLIDCWDAIFVGSQYVPEAQEYTSTSAPYTGVIYVRGNAVTMPDCH